MDDKGLTLVETLAVMVIIGIMAFIAVPLVNKTLENSRDSAYKKQLILLDIETTKWANANYNKLPIVNNGTMFLEIKDLISDGSIENKLVINPKTGKNFEGCLKISYDELNKQYTTKYIEQSCNSALSALMPILSQNEETIEVYSDYVVKPNISATTNYGKIVNAKYLKIIDSNNTEVSEINTSFINRTYTVKYKVLDDDLNKEFILDYKVNIKDTQKPVLAVKGLQLYEGNYLVNYESLINVRDYISITDNSCGKTGTDSSVNGCDYISNMEHANIIVEGSINPNVIGNYQIAYKIKDSSGNMAVLSVPIKVVDVSSYVIDGPINRCYIPEGDILTTGYKYTNGQYMYYYKGLYNTSKKNLWNMSLTNKGSTDPVTTVMCTHINDIPITGMRYAFSESKAKSIDFSSFNTINVDDMSYMFSNNKTPILQFDNFNTKDVVDMTNMFYGNVRDELDLTAFDLSKVGFMDSMFAVSEVKKIIFPPKKTLSAFSMSSMFSNFKTEELDLSLLDTKKVEFMNGMFSYSKIGNLNLSEFDTSFVLSMKNMFYESEIGNINFSSFNTTRVTDMSRMFYKSKLPNELDLSSFSTPRVIDMSSMFAFNNSQILDISNFDTSNVEKLDCMFFINKANTIKFPSTLNMIKIKNINNMFGYSRIKEFSLNTINTNKIIDTSSMFAGCNSLEKITFKGFDTSSVTNMSNMFSSMYFDGEFDISNLKTQNVTNMYCMFCSSNINNLNLSSFNTSKVTNMSSMFWNNYATTLDLSSFDTSKVTDISKMFSDSKITTGYARTQADANKFNSSSGKPRTLNFTVK